MPEAMSADLLVERARPDVLLIRLNRQERRNALATPLLLQIAEALAEAGRDDGIRAVVLTGNERLFAAGADIDELAANGSGDPVETPRFLAWVATSTFTKPLVTAVEGWCLGAGTELMLCADIVIAGAEAKIGLPETNLGVMPGAGGTAILPRRVGTAMATKMVLTGDAISAEGAQRIGLIAEVARSGEALDTALALAERLTQRAPLALQAAMASIRDATLLDEREHLMAERRRFIALLDSEDKAEGIAAFREKRPPLWTAR